MNPISAMLTSLPGSFADAVRISARLGFTHVDVVAVSDRRHEDLEVLAEAGLLVSCASVGRGLPKEQSLDASDLGLRRKAIETLKLQIADAAKLGATVCYVVPGHDGSPEALERFADSVGCLADFAAGRMLKFCIEHSPGRALAAVAQTLKWLQGLGHPNAYLLLDLGHCLITHEHAAEAVASAGSRLGYVHLDDNDGVGDLHWPLLTGVLTEDYLRQALAAIGVVGYASALALELNPGNTAPEEALVNGKNLVQQILLSTRE